MIVISYTGGTEKGNTSKVIFQQLIVNVFLKIFRQFSSFFRLLQQQVEVVVTYLDVNLSYNFIHILFTAFLAHISPFNERL